ncbi:hypothetical protein VT50_0234415 [Streptomyces antioxidans]|uniref:Uncharacterized protein n=1 Tax=Streptomyces antioxidans TaxID=1507734 RepID=A0A1V4CV58_9ACTN|nr:hypothetical protein [Streptomyces antioxidans]OPF71360.1 hypothetical protein VT50_0234415 [Streptomyces antioxidans]
MSVTVDAPGRHVPIRLDVERWATRPVHKRILAVVHTVTSGKRLLEAVRLFEDDLRVQVVFTVAPDVFGHGVAEFLDGLSALVLPWHQAVEVEFDLAIAAAHGGMHELHAPVIVLPHGAGHNKFVPGGRRGRVVRGREVYGLNRQWLVRDGAVVPDTIVLAHTEDLARLRRQCPEAVPAASVVGDPSYDRILASLPARALYRAALRTGPGHRLVVVSSTWGPRSLLGQAPEVLERLVTELPPEEFRIVAMFHPNAWNAHGEWQIQAWLAGLRRRGLMVVGQHADELGPLVAADFVVADHGSMALYGAATGAPVVMGCFSPADVSPDSPMAELASFAPGLNRGRSLRAQLESGYAGHRPERYARVAARITSEPGRFARNMRALLYRKLGLRAPTARPLTEPARLSYALDPGGQGSAAA